MAFPSKKPDMSVILGIGGKKPTEQAPPPYEATAPAADPMEGAEGEGMCSIMCPKCGEPMNLVVQPAPEAEAAAPEAEPGGREAVA